jgi:hypothetical protein
MNEDDNYVGKVNLDELYQRKKMIQDNKIKIFNKILKRIHDKIKHISRQRNSHCFCAFVIPEFLLGTPRYDCGACTAHVIGKLKDNGFVVKYTNPNLLFISWDHYIPPTIRNEYKKKTGITINGFGEQLRSKDTTITKSNNPNDLLLKDKNISVKKKDNINFTDINTYKPKGNFIYNTALIKKIQDKTSK